MHILALISILLSQFELELGVNTSSQSHSTRSDHFLEKLLLLSYFWLNASISTATCILNDTIGRPSTASSITYGVYYNIDYASFDCFLSFFNSAGISFVLVALIFPSACLFCLLIADTRNRVFSS